MTFSPKIYDDMKLYNTSDSFYIEAADNPQEVLVIKKDGSPPHVLHINEFIRPKSEYRAVCGVLGTIRLLSGYHLIVATHRIRIGLVNGFEIFQLAGFDILPYIQKKSRDEYDLQYMRMLRNVLQTPYMYFSYDYDITHTIQHFYTEEAAPSEVQDSRSKRCDERFFWNGHLLKQFRDKIFEKFALPIMHGFISISFCSVNGKLFTWSLISRRSLYRAGPRLFKRGIDKNGYVANFVETEQILEYNNSITSFVQTRGSIPIYWNQLPNLKYKPRPKILPDENHLQACGLHMSEQLDKYGSQVLVNLIDQTGSEKNLEKSYQNIIDQFYQRNATTNNDMIDQLIKKMTASKAFIRYESFDFHSECRNLKWDKLDTLINRLAHEQDSFSYFMRQNGLVLSRQTGVFRTNCIDCLDRTNVVQSLLARRSLESIMKQLEILKTRDAIKIHDNFESLFKTVWADNADFISIQYSGTGALKNDFTRTGKRTKRGLMNDLFNSARRYYKNNFSDGFRQDSIDLFLGKYEINEWEGITIPCRLCSNKDWKYITFPSILLIAIAMFFASVIFPNEYSTEILLYLMFWGAMVGSTLAIIFKYGKEFVDYPKLSDFTVPTIRTTSPENGFQF